MKRNRVGIGRSGDGLGVAAAVAAGKFDEMLEELLAEALSAGGCADGDQMHVAYRLGLRPKAEKKGEHDGTVADDKGGVAKLPDQHRVVQVMRVPAVPELRQVIENLMVILRRAGRNFNGHRRILHCV